MMREGFQYFIYVASDWGNLVAEDGTAFLINGNDPDNMTVAVKSPNGPAKEYPVIDYYLTKQRVVLADGSDYEFTPAEAPFNGHEDAWGTVIYRHRTPQELRKELAYYERKNRPPCHQQAFTKCYFEDLDRKGCRGCFIREAIASRQKSSNLKDD